MRFCQLSHLIILVALFGLSCKKTKTDSIPTSPSPGTTATTVSTIAGIYVEDMVRLKDPNGIVIDANGNVFVADQRNYCIRKITPAGVMTIFAGSTTGIAGHKDGTGTQAIFSNIAGMVLDQSGNIIAADCGTGYIRKITPTAVVTTIAGDGNLATTNGPALSASFYFPKGINIDSKGSIYITDRNSLIRKIDVSGNVSTFAGSTTLGNKDGLGASALFNDPTNIAIDAADNLFITDRINHTIRKIDKNANVTTIAGTGQQGFTDGIGTAASFKFPTGIAVDKTGNLFLAEAGNNVIRKITPSAVVTVYAGTGSAGLVNGPANVATFKSPISVELDPNGVIYIGDGSNGQVRKISTNQIVSSIQGDFSPLDGPGTGVYFKKPSGMSTDSQGNLFVADAGNNMIRKISPNGYVTHFAGKISPSYSDGSGSTASFDNPVGLFINEKNDVFVADSGNYAIRKISTSGLVSTVIKNKPHAISAPTGVYLDKNDQLYFTETGYGWIYKQNSAGNLMQLASGTSLGQFSGMFWFKPYQILVDNKGYIYVADAGNHRICKSTDGGNYFTVLAGRQSPGNIAIYGREDGQGTAAAFYSPKAMVIDKDANLYVADASNNVIRKISSAGMVTTLAGAGTKGHADGAASTATFNHPAGLALSPDQTILYVADQGNNLIRKITLGK